MWERWIQFHELNIKREPKDAPPIELEKIIPLLKKRWESGESAKLIKNETAAIRILDMKTYSKKKATALLIQYTDKNVTDPVFSNLTTGDIRTEPKLDGEGVAVSAHAVLFHEPLNGNPETYRFLLEEVPGIGRSRLTPFLRSEFKTACTHVFEYQDEESGQTKKCLPAVEILGDLSAQLSDEIDNGSVLQGVELIKHVKGKQMFDEDKFFIEVSRHVKITPVLNSGEKVYDVLKKIGVKAKKEGYDDLKIRYKLPKGKQKTATMGATKEDIADTLIVRDEHIRSDEILGQCPVKILDHFVRKMIDLST